MDNLKIPALDGTPAARLAVEHMHEQRQMGLVNFGKQQVEEALAILRRYMDGKSSFDARVKEEYLWWRRRHWDIYSKDGKRTPAGAQLFNSIENKIADIYDNIPECSFLARSQDDEETAKMLSGAMPAILEENDIEGAYIDVAREKVPYGTGVYHVTWDTGKRNGLGDSRIGTVSPLNLYAEPGVDDIQLSPHLFYIDYQPNEVLKAEYPQLDGKLGTSGITVQEVRYDDQVDNTQRTPVIEYYYKRKVGTRKVLHYAKICCEEVLYASENDPQYAERGWYDHGKYPFIPDVMFPLPGTWYGIGYITVGKDNQRQIDRLTNAIVRNSIIAATRRKYIKKGASVNIDELMDIERDVVEIGGNGNIHDMVMAVDEPSLSGNYLSVLVNLEDTLKEVTSNRDFAQGGTSGGVTSGTAISALVEAGNKQSRTIIRRSYDAYKEVVTMVLDLHRQFGIHERAVRIVGDAGTTEYKTFDNAGLVPRAQIVNGQDMGKKLPVFDIMIRPHKKSPFARVTQNSMMQEFYGLGFFDPNNATQALACLEGMEFDGKEQLVRKIEENGTLLDENNQLKQTMLRLAAVIDQTQGTDLTEQMAHEFGVEMPQKTASGGTQTPVEEAPDVMQSQTDPRMQKAAEQIANTTAV